MKKRYVYRIALVLLLVGLVACQSAPPEQNTVAAKTIDPSTDSNTFNWYLPGYKQWAFQNMDKVFATASIAKGGETQSFDKNLTSFENLQIQQIEGQTLSYREHLEANQTDALLVLHKGKIVAEEYLGTMQPESYHNWFSMTKSFTALLVGILAEEGIIDLSKSTLEYMPELKGTAWEGTTVQMVMDMTVGIQFNEDYHDPESDLYQFGRAARFTEFENLPSKFASVLDYLKSVKQQGKHDEAFHYVSLNTEVLGMIITKVTGRQPAELMSEKIWSKLGAEQDAYIVQDPTGLQLVSAAVNTTLRDAGRFGQMVLNNGMVNNQQVIPLSLIETIKRGGSAEKFAPSKRGQQFKGFSYTNQWWHTDGPEFFAKGLFGQWMYIHPEEDIVIVKYSTSTIPSPDWTNDLRLIQAICEQLK